MQRRSTNRVKLRDAEIREVAGGCICCSAGIMFEVSLVMLLQRRPVRLLIEPTGLAALPGILDTLNRPGIREAPRNCPRRFCAMHRAPSCREFAPAATDEILGSRSSSKATNART